MTNAATGQAANPTLILPPDAPAAVAAPLPPAATPVQSIKSRALRGSMWTMFAFGAGQLIRFVSSPILAYLLTPEDFGTIALVSVFVGSLACFADVGIEQAVIQSKRGDDETFLHTAWTLHVLRGIVLWLGCCLIAYPVYWLYRDKGNAHYLLAMLPVVGLNPLIAGFNSARIFSHNRHLQLGRITLMALGHQLVAVAIQISFAFVWRSPWSIVCGGMAGSCFYCLASHTLLPGLRDRFRWDASVRHELLHFGKWIMVSTIFTFIALQIDRPLLGKMMDEALLGIYMVAMNLVRVPAEVIGRLTSVTLFPALARAAEKHPQEMARVFRRARGLILDVCVALSLGIILAGPVFVRLFYKQRWHPAAEFTQWSMVGGWFLLLQLSADRALLAAGKTRPLAVSNLVCLIVTVIGAFAGHYVDVHHFGGGITGFILGAAAGRVAGHMMIQFEMSQISLPILRQDVLYTLLLGAACALALLGPRAFPAYHDHQLAYDAVTALTVCTVACAWATLNVIRGFR